jgi:hypothetical protein
MVSGWQLPIGIHWFIRGFLTLLASLRLHISIYSNSCSRRTGGVRRLDYVFEYSIVICDHFSKYL